MDDTKNNIYARWVSGDISEEELESLRSTGELDQLQSILSIADNLTLKNYDQERAYQNIVNQRQVKKRRHVIPLMDNKLAALAAVLIGVLSVYLLTYTQSEIIEYQALPGAMVTVDLPDESSAVLNAGSDITFDMGSYTVERLIHLEGEASFDVESGSPFRVETTVGTVEVLGTEFNVRAWDEALAVECYEGSVRVTAPSSSVVLRAMESAVLQEDGQLQVVTIQHSEPYWQQGISRFDSTSVEYVFAELMRQYDVKIIYEGRIKIFTGAFSHGSLDTALQEVCRPLGLSYNIDPDKKRIFIQ